MKIALFCENLEFSYPKPSLSFNFSVSIPKDNFALILGKSGAGKSTFLSLIAGFLKPERGRLLLSDILIENQLPHERDIAILFQNYNVFPHLTVFENIALGLCPSLRLSYPQKKEVLHILKELEMEPWIHQKTASLSAGQLQRVGLGRCLIQKKSIILLDEPFSSLDPELRANMIKLVWEKSKKYQKTVLMVTHFPSEAEAYADQFVHIEQGRILKKPVFIRTPLSSSA